MNHEEIKSAAEGLCNYVKGGCGVSSLAEDMEPLMVGQLEFGKLRPLKLMSSAPAKFVGVDCSTIRLMGGNRFGVYVLRAAVTLVGRDRKVEMKFEEHVKTVTGDKIRRKRTLENLRLEYESELGLHVANSLDGGDYLLLDGTSNFGREENQRRFKLELYEKCRGKGIVLLAISKKTTAMTSRGVDFLSSLLAEDIKERVWLYHPFQEADPHEHLYGDFSFVKLSPLNCVAFRCDVMDYLTGGDLVETLSPLTAISQDARCLGYPICLYLAHNEGKVASPKLLHYRDVVKREVHACDPDVLRKVLIEEVLANFRDQAFYGLKNPWEVQEFV